MMLMIPTIRRRRRHYNRTTTNSRNSSSVGYFFCDRSLDVSGMFHVVMIICDIGFPSMLITIVIVIIIVMEMIHGFMICVISINSTNIIRVYYIYIYRIPTSLCMCCFVLIPYSMCPVVVTTRCRCVGCRMSHYVVPVINIAFSILHTRVHHL